MILLRWPKLGLALYVEAEIQILKVIYLLCKLELQIEFYILEIPIIAALNLFTK